MNNKLLFITQVYPSALTGTTVKTRRTIEYLLDHDYKVDVCCVHYPKMVKNEFKRKGLKIYTVEKNSILSKVSLAYLVRIFKLLFSFIPVRVKKMFDQKLEERINSLDNKNQYDYIFYDGFSTLQYLKTKSKRNIYIDDEDITDLLIKRIKKEKNPLLKIFFFSEYLKCLIYERVFLPKVEQVWAIAPNTMKRLKTLTKAKTFLMPTIVPERANAFRVDAKDLVFTGLLSWMENVNGLKWFLDNFWVTLRKKYPNLKLHVIGQMAQTELVNYLKNFEGVILHGYVPDLSGIYQKSALAISPILINSGIKVKVLTYLSYGLPVVSLKQATWGLTTNDGIEVANESNFGFKVMKVLADKSLRKTLSKKAIINISRNHSYESLKRFFEKTGIFKK